MIYTRAIFLSKVNLEKALHLHLFYLLFNNRHKYLGGNQLAGKVLIVDDTEDSRLLLKDLLSYYGYDILEAKTGEEGIMLASEKKPDLILLDIQMPNMNGVTVCSILRSNSCTKDIKIIAVTSFAMKGDKEKFLLFGFDGYISKPIDVQYVVQLVKEMIGEGGK